MSDSEIIDAYDSEAEHVSVGLNYWTDELERRSRERSTKATNRLSLASFVLSIVSTLIAIAALLATVATT